MYLDASAIVAILAEEDDASIYMERIERATTPFITSPLSVFEAVAALAKTRKADDNKPVTAEMLDYSREAVTKLMKELGVREAVISAGIGRKAMDAMSAYGKIVAHPARLNFGDCFAYACAKAYRAPLLYKGDDFAKTDIAEGEEEET